MTGGLVKITPKDRAIAKKNGYDQGYAACLERVEAIEANIKTLKRRLSGRLVGLIIDCQAAKDQLMRVMDDPTSRDIPSVNGIGGSALHDITVACAELNTLVICLVSIKRL